MLEKTTKLLKFPYRDDIITIPFAHIAGAEEGPRMVISAGVHGCEYSPIIAAIKLFQELSPENVTGTIDIIPIVNMPAFNERTPFVCPKDGKNPNRECPGSPEGSYTQALVWHLLHDIVSGADYYIDIHCGDIVEKIEPFAMYHTGGDPATERASRELAFSYGLPNVIATGDRTDWPDHYTTYANAAKMGIPSIIAECGGYGQVTPEAVQTHREGLHNLLKIAGLIPGTAMKPGSVREFSDFVWINTPVAGIFMPDVTVGDEVVENDRIGQITDYFGNPKHVMRSPVSGRILFIETTPAMQENSLTMAVGKYK